MRNKRRIGVLDVFVGMMIFLGAVGLILRARILQSDLDADETRSVVCLAQDLPAEVAECLIAGEVFYTADGTAWGILNAVEASPAKLSVMHEGEWFFGEDTTGERIDLTLTLTVSGVASEGGFLRDGKYAVLRGDRVQLYGERVSLSLLICSVSAE